MGEKIMLGVFILMLVLWATGKMHGIHTGVVALIGVMILVLTRTEKWEDITDNKEAWDAMVWLGGMVCMAGLLKDHGFIAWFAETRKGGHWNGVPWLRRSPWRSFIFIRCTASRC